MENHAAVGIERPDRFSQLDRSEILPPPLRLAVGLGDPAREREILPVLGESSTFLVAERCLAADQLLSCLRTERIDAVLIAADLHRLNDRMLGEIARTGVPLVLLASSGVDETWLAAGTIVPADAGPDLIREALLAAVRGERPLLSPLHVLSHDVPAPTPDEALPSPTLCLIAVASGHGSPGRTTVALNLAIGLGAVAPTLLVDADLGGASVAAFLDADPTRNLAMLAHAAPETPRDWERALDQETQPLAARSPHGTVLCGVPKPELRASVTAHFFERLITEARRRYRYVIVDVGAELLSAEMTLHRLALGLADQILLVSTADLVGLSHARSSLGLLRTQLGIRPERVALLLNRHDRKYHHGRADIEWTLGTPIAGVVPEDHAGAQRALVAQRPLVLDRRSRAGRAALDLAERIHGGSVVLPPELPTGSSRLPLATLRVPLFRWLDRRSGVAGRLGG